MGNRNTITKVIPTKRFAGATEEDLTFQVSLQDTSRELIQGDRTVNLNLNNRFNEERQTISTYRPYGKIYPMVDNCYSGLAVDEVGLQFTSLLFQQLFYDQPAASPWPGYPQFKEFDIQREDVDEFLSTTTNWNMFITYPTDCNGDEIMYYQQEEAPTSRSIRFTASQGIPFYVLNITENGRDAYRFYCPTPHGLSLGEYVQLSLDDGLGTSYQFVGASNTFAVYSLGDGKRNSELTVFTLIIPQGNISTTPLPDYTFGTMKRQLNPTSSDSISVYYVRNHKILTEYTDAVVNDCGFEQQPFPNIKQVERITPTGVCRVATKNAYPSYLYSFTKDVDVKDLRDNLGRPLTNLYISVFLRNDLGYFDYPPRYGWEWNFPLTFIDSSVDGNGQAGPNVVRGDFGNPQPSGVIVSNIGGGVMNRGIPLRVGDTLRGGFCEYNKEELKERVISDMRHKFNWNEQVFNHAQRISITDPYLGSNYDLMKGYVYIPHHEVPIRRFSTYIEFGDPKEVVNVPDWAEYWESSKQWRWRDLYDIGFIDNGVGVDYPFLNDAQYPSKIIPFYVQRQIRFESDDSVTAITETIETFVIDGCE
jgi:hypothetical protein